VRIAALWLALACAALMAGPAAARKLVLFPTPYFPLTQSPPLATTIALPNLLRGPVESRELIDVGMDEHGSVRSIAVTQRLVLHQTADYRLTIPAPVRDVEPAAGSQSVPGQREGAILWQGFASGRKVLAARATLDPAAAVSSLPLRLGLSVRIAGKTLGPTPRTGPLDVSLHLHNTTRVSVTTFSGDGDRSTLAKILDTLRRDPGGRSLGRSTYVGVEGLTPVRTAVDAPLRVTGRLRFAAGTVEGGTTSFATVLGGSRPLDRTIHLRGKATGVRAPHLELTVSPVFPVEELRPPSGRTWAQAVHSNGRLNGRRLLAHAIEVSLRLARVRQYRTFLLDPDPNGQSAARYDYRSLPRPAVVRPVRAPASSGGLGPVPVALIAVGAVLGAGALVVLWAHS
jgi:hypothetical protein